MRSILVQPFETAIIALHDAFKGAGIDQAYGPSIILFTCLLKLATYPLTKQQIESTTKMQARMRESRAGEGAALTRDDRPWRPRSSRDSALQGTSRHQ